MVYFLFVVHPMELRDKLAKQAEAIVNAKVSQLQSGSCAPETLDNSTQDLAKHQSKISQSEDGASYPCQALLKGLEIQLSKVNNEIQSRLNQEMEWYKIKYLYAGLILFGFLINTFFKGGPKNTDFTHIEQSFQTASTSYVTSLVLATTVMVAVSIDMQIGSGRMVINQLGLWIYHYAEPILLGTKAVGWEAFLRLEGGHQDPKSFYAMIYWPNIYFLSVGLYILYLVVTKMALKRKPNSSRKSILLFGFCMLHGTLLLAALSIHSIPVPFVMSTNQLTAFAFWLVLISASGAYLDLWRIKK